MHIVLNVHFEAVSPGKEEKEGNDIPTYGEKGALGKRVENHRFRYLRYQIYQGGYWACLFTLVLNT